MRYGSVYVITNKHTGGQYVGQTRKNVEKRWDSHWRTAICAASRKAKFQKILLEFGKDAFQVQELFVAFDATALNQAEIDLIAEIHPIYNSSKGGMGSTPIVVSNAVKKMRSDAAKLRWADPEWRAKTVASLKAAHQTPEAKERGRALRIHCGTEKRWAGHVKAVPIKKDKVAAIAASWKNPDIRKRRIDGAKAANAKPEVKAKRSDALRRRTIKRSSIEASARAKWKPLYCPQLQLTFLCGKYAAEYFGVLHTSVSNAVKQKGKLLKKYSLEMVA